MRAAVAAHERGAHERAEVLYRALTEQYPRFADAWHYAGLLAHQRGDRETALARMERAYQLEPENLVFMLNMGRALREMGQPLRSIKCLERAHELAPDHAQALLQLTESLLTVERGGEMIPEIKRHLGWAGDHWHLWMLLGSCHEQNGELASAAAAFAQAAAMAPAGETRPHLRRAEAARKNEDIDTVRKALREALQIDPDSAEARVELANLHSEKGDFAEAERLAREALAIDPRQYGAWGLIATGRQATPGDGFAEELEAAAGRAGDDPVAWPLHFARGRTWEKLGDYDRAFGAYAKGNSLRDRMLTYSADSQVEYTRNLIENLDRDFVHRASTAGRRGSGAIFICGMPRSGTTLVESILASHPDVQAGGEMRFIHDRIRQNLGLAGMTHTGSWLRELDGERLGSMAREWHEVLRRCAVRHARITDKMPGNFALLGLVHACFPDAHIIHVQRDARDNCFSCYATAFAERHSFSCRLESSAHYYRLYQALMRHWRQILPAGTIIDVQYEELVSDPETRIRTLVESVGLDWNPRCMDFHKHREKVSTASLYQVRQPLYRSSVGRWRHFEHHLGPLLEGLSGPSPL